MNEDGDDIHSQEANELLNNNEEINGNAEDNTYEVLI